MSKFFDGQVYFNNLPTHKRKHYGWKVVGALVAVVIAISVLEPTWVVVLPWNK